MINSVFSLFPSFFPPLILFCHDQGTAYRVVHSRDIVPHLSLCCHGWLGKCRADEETCPYQHSSEVWYRFSKNTVTVPLLWSFRTVTVALPQRYNPLLYRYRKITVPLPYHYRVDIMSSSYRYGTVAILRPYNHHTRWTHSEKRLENFSLLLVLECV